MTTAHEPPRHPAGAELSRRHWLRGMALTGAVVTTGAGLAACSAATPSQAGPAPAATRDTAPGTADESGSGPASSGAPGTAPPATRGTAPPETPNDLAPSFVVGKASTIPVGGGVIYPKHGVVVTQPTAGAYKCFNASCTHLGCTVNRVTAGLILCPCHGAKFSIVDGSVKAGPALRPLTEEDFTIKNGDIVLD